MGNEGKERSIDLIEMEDRFNLERRRCNKLNEIIDIIDK